MKQITGITEYSANRWKVEFDDEEKMLLHFDVIQKHSLSVGMTLTESEYNEIIYTGDIRRAKERALYLLDIKDYSFKELFLKLSQNYSEDICFEVMNILCDAGLINDYSYAAKLAEKLVCYKYRGYYRAKQEMKQKGLSNEIIDEALSEYSERFEENLRLLIENKYLSQISDRKSLQRVKQALIRQGYSYTEINNVISDFEFEFY